MESPDVFNPTELVIDAYVDRLRAAYHRTYGKLEPDYPGILAYVGRMALEIIANTDAAYHDVRHTIMVTEVGQEILKGKHLTEGGMTPLDWLNFVISLLTHDIGYVRGICRGDRDGRYVIDSSERTVTLPPGATDAALTIHHVDRGKRFIVERFGDHAIIDTDVVCANIERTRFPVPDAGDSRISDDFPGLVRAADFIGQLADINHMQQISALFSEFQETGVAEKLGFKTAADLRSTYPAFFWNQVNPYLRPALDFLRVTQEGKYWLANLFAHVFAEEHQIPSLGPEPNRGA